MQTEKDSFAPHPTHSLKGAEQTGLMYLAHPPVDRDLFAFQ